jgi:hypothetical protein
MTIETIDDLDLSIITYSLKINAAEVSNLLEPAHIKKVNSALRMGASGEDLRSVVGSCFEEVIRKRLGLKTGASIMVFPSNAQG